MKIVLDTNVFISGIFWGGSPHIILEMWTINKIQILMTRQILEEYLRVLWEISPNEKVVAQWATFIAANAIVLEDQDHITLCRDPDDDKFLNCAIAGAADYLISGDKDLLSLKKIGSTPIMNPTQFLKIFS